LPNQEKKKITTDIKIFAIVSIVIALIITAAIIYIGKPKDIVTVQNNRVNSDEFRFYYTQNLSNYSQYMSYFSTEQEYLSYIKEQTLQQVIEIQILLLDAKKDGFKVDTKEINDIWKQMEQDIRENASMSGLSVRDFSKQALGTNLSKLKGIYNNYIIYQKYIEHKVNEMPVDDEELTAYYEENKESFDYNTVRHILILCERDAEDDVVAEKSKMAQDVLDKVNNGDDFDTLALEYSEDTGSQNTGGVYEVTQTSDYVPEFKEWTFTHKAGDTGIVRTDHGFHVMRLDNIYDSLEAQKEYIQMALRYNKFQTYMNESLNSEEYKVDVKDEYNQF